MDYLPVGIGDLDQRTRRIVAIGGGISDPSDGISFRDQVSGRNIDTVVAFAEQNQKSRSGTVLTAPFLSGRIADVGMSLNTGSGFVGFRSSTQPTMLMSNRYIAVNQKSKSGTDLIGLHSK